MENVEMKILSKKLGGPASLGDISLLQRLSSKGGIFTLFETQRHFGALPAPHPISGRAA
jgi:hypothetical protein